MFNVILQFIIFIIRSEEWQIIILTKTISRYNFLNIKILRIVYFNEKMKLKFYNWKIKIKTSVRHNCNAMSKIIR